VNKRLLSVLIFALAVSAVASFLLYRLIVAQMSSSAKTAEVQLLVASRTLQTGELIKDSDVKLADWGGPMPAGSFLKPEDVVGRGVVEPIYAGEALVDSRIAPRGAGAGLAATIPAGMRAVAVRVNDVVGVAGFVTPGMKVDILIAGNPPGNSAAGTQTKTLLQNIEVLSAGQNIQKDAEGKPVSVPVVNLLVTPEQAEVLSLASNETRIQLVLRNPTDNAVVKTPGTAIAYLFNGREAVPPPPAKRPVKRAAPVKPVPAAPPPVAAPAAPEKMAITVEIINGSKKSETKFVQDKDNKDSKPEGKQQ
jgi:pilus assembly protein CpaB